MVVADYTISCIATIKAMVAPDILSNSVQTASGKDGDVGTAIRRT